MAREPEGPDLGAEEEDSLDELLDPGNVVSEYIHPELEPDLHGINADRNDLPDPMDPTGSEWENGPGVDVSDPNLSQVAAEAGAEERLEDLGKLYGEDDGEEMELEDPARTEE